MSTLLEDMLADASNSSNINVTNPKDIKQTEGVLFKNNFEPLPGFTLDYEENGNFDQEDELVTWNFPPLRMTSQTGGQLVWQIGYDPANQRLIRRRGYELTPSGEPGTINDDYINIEINKSGRSLANQALLQAKKQYLDKTREGYSLPEMIRVGDVLPPAQLACTYRSPDVKTAKKSNERAIPEKELQRCPVACQVKIDGQRCRVMKTDRGIEMISRTNVKIDWHDHIREELRIFFRYLPEGVGLDGELQGSGLFEDTSSKIRQKHVQHAENEDIKFYVFDLIVPEVILEDRITTLFNAFDKYRESYENKNFFLLQHSYASTHQEIDYLLHEALRQGYEGLMIRFFAGNKPTKKQLETSWYKGKRNTNLLKYKLFNDEEGVIIDVLQGKDRNEGAAIFVLEDPRGNKFKCVPHGSLEDLQRYYANKDDYIGQLYTYKYQELTKYGIPRFPTGIRFRNYEQLSIKSGAKI